MFLTNLALTIVCLAVVVTSALAFLAVFRFGDPPKTYVRIEDCFRLTLLQVLMVELLVLAILVCAVNFLSERQSKKALAAAEAREKTLVTKNDFLTSDVVRYWVQSGGG